MKGDTWSLDYSSLDLGKVLKRENVLRAQRVNRSIGMEHWDFEAFKVIAFKVCSILPWSVFA